MATARGQELVLDAVVERGVVAQLAFFVRSGYTSCSFVRRLAVICWSDRKSEMNTDSLFDLSAPEKLQLVEDLWDDLAATPSEVPISTVQSRMAARKCFWYLAF